MRLQRLTTACLPTVLLALACSRPAAHKDDAARVDPIPSAATAGISATAASAQAALAEAGNWVGDYSLTTHAIVMKPEEGAVAEWSRDDTKALTGKGRISVTIAPDGTVSGVASGALGTQRVLGMVDGDQLRLQLLPDGTAAASSLAQGTWVGKLSNGTYSGQLQASSGDSLKARRGPLELKKAGG
jgi:hypothetical protein